MPATSDVRQSPPPEPQLFPMTPIAARGLALLLTSPAFAAWSPPDPAQLARLERVLAPLHEQYNPAE